MLLCIPLYTLWALLLEYWITLLKTYNLCLSSVDNSFTVAWKLKHSYEFDLIWPNLEPHYHNSVHWSLKWDEAASIPILQLPEDFFVNEDGNEWSKS